MSLLSNMLFARPSSDKSIGGGSAAASPMAGASASVGASASAGAGGSGSGSAQPTEYLQLKYVRANALVSSIFNKFYNGSARAVDPFVIRALQEEETRLYSIQYYIDQGPVEKSREFRDSDTVKSSIKMVPSLNFVSRLFGICGGYFGPGSIMRKWDILSEGGFEDAMTEYIGVVDKALPGWDDQPLDYPVSKQDKFWKDDAAVENCQHCGAMFGLQQRRHHCRLCFDIFCTGCCREELEVALCPGAPLRMQRVCASCFLDVERNQGLLEVRRMIRENHDMEQKIKEIQMSTEALMVAKQREEAKLREQAAACGCDLVALDNAIQKKIGSPVALVVKTPPAHKFTPRESLEAKQQLALANRQLFMALKGAQCRSKKALDKMDVTLTVLREAVCFGSSHWNVILRHARPFLTLRDIKRLGAVSLGFRTCLLRHKSDQRCIFEQGIAPSRLRMCVWQAECLSDSKTRAYVLDLAEALSATRVDSSDSDNDEDMPSRSANPTATPESSTSSQGKWRPHPVAPDSNRESLRLALIQDPSSAILSRSSLWKRAYDVILNRCGADTQLEHDAQILSDVHRTFGASPLRKIKRKSYSARAMGMGNPTASLNGAPGATVTAAATASSTSSVVSVDDGLPPLEVRQASLRNILRAFSSVNTEIGYCQGMDFVTALLLSVVDWNETKAFWLLTSLVASPRYQLEMLYCPGIPHLNLRCFQLERLTDQHLPELGAYLREIDFPVSMFATSWFMTLFTNMEMFPYDVVVRLVDGFLLAGWKHLFRVALVVLEALEHHILASAFEEIPQVFYNIQEVAPILASEERVMARAAQFKVTNTMLRKLEGEYEATLKSPRSMVSSPRRSTVPTISHRDDNGTAASNGKATNANANGKTEMHANGTNRSNSSGTQDPTGKPTARAFSFLEEKAPSAAQSMPQPQPAPAASITLPPPAPIQSALPGLHPSTTSPTFSPLQSEAPPSPVISPTAKEPSTVSSLLSSLFATSPRSNSSSSSSSSSSLPQSQPVSLPSSSSSAWSFSGIDRSVSVATTTASGGEPTARVMRANSSSASITHSTTAPSPLLQRKSSLGYQLYRQSGSKSPDTPRAPSPLLSPKTTINYDLPPINATYYF